MSPRWGLGTLGGGSSCAFTPSSVSHRKMQHKNLVRLLGVILHQGLYIVMEHVSKVRWGRDAGGGAGGTWRGSQEASNQSPMSPSPPPRATW